MLTKPRAALLIALLAVVTVILLFLKWQHSSLPADSSSSRGNGARAEGRVTPETHSTTAKSKTGSRPPKEEPDFGKTLNTLQTVIPGLTELPEQTLQERILATNSLLKKHGIALRFGVDEILYPSNHLLDLKVPAFSKENARPCDILRQDVKAMDKHYFISGDKVLYQDGSGG